MVDGKAKAEETRRLGAVRENGEERLATDNSPYPPLPRRRGRGKGGGATETFWLIAICYILSAVYWFTFYLTSKLPLKFIVPSMMEMGLAVPDVLFEPTGL